MKTKQKIAVPILADEKYLTTSRRKSVNEKQRQKPSVIYLDKSLAGFVSP